MRGRSNERWGRVVMESIDDAASVRMPACRPYCVSTTRLPPDVVEQIRSHSHHATFTPSLSGSGVREVTSVHDPKLAALLLFSFFRPLFVISHVHLMKGELQFDLRAGAACPPSSLRPSISAQFANAAFEHPPGTGVWSTAAALRSFSKMVPGSRRRPRGEETLSEEASL